MREKFLNANIWKYYVLRVFSKRLVWPILTIYLVRNDLSPAEIGTIFAVGTIIGLILEVPSGAIADKIGRRAAMTIAHAGWGISMFVLYAADSFLGLLAGQAIYQAAGSLWTGTHEAFIYETLHELKREKEIKKITGKALFISQVTTGVLFILVPIIAKIDLRLPFLINAFVFLISAGIAYRLAEPERTRSVAKEEAYKDILGFRTFFTNKKLLIIGLFFALLSGISGILADFRQLYLEVINFDIALFGFVYLALRLITGFTGAHVEQLEKLLGKKVVFWLMPVSMLLTYGGLALLNSFYGLIFIALDGIHSGISRPIEQEYLNQEITSSMRATLLSVFNLGNELLWAGAVFASGFIIDVYGVQAGFAFAAALTLVCVFPAGFLLTRKVFLRA